MTTTPQVRYGNYLNFDDSEILPDRLSTTNKHSRYKLEPSCLKFILEWATPPINVERDVYCVQGNQSINSSCGIFYYETTIESRHGNREPLISVFGFSKSQFESRICQRHLHNESFYFGLAGCIKTLEFNDKQYGPPMYTGDTCGCGIDFSTQTIFFTHNGQYLDTAYTAYNNSTYYPVVGFDNGKLTASVNFGASPFKFNIEEYVQKSVDSVCVTLKNYQPDFDIHTAIAKHIYDYLIYYGYTQTAEQLKVSKWLQTLPNDMECDFRQEVFSHIRIKQTSEAINIINKKYKEKLSMNSIVLMELLFFQFVDSCYELDKYSVYKHNDDVEEDKTTKDDGDVQQSATTTYMCDLIESQSFDVSFSKSGHQISNIEYNDDNKLKWHEYFKRLNTSLEYGKLLKHHFDSNFKSLEFYEERVKRVLCLLACTHIEEFNYPELVSKESRVNLINCVNEFLLKCASNNTLPPKPALTKLPLIFKTNIHNYKKWKHPRLGPFTLKSFCFKDE